MENYKEYDEQIECPYPIVAIKAVDWAMYEDICYDQTKLKLVPGMICGWLLEMSEEKVVVCMEKFGLGTRHAVVIPKLNILEIEVIRPKSSNTK
jgi:hypothetical protein